jgi:Fe-S cluster assembly protein SufD
VSQTFLQEFESRSGTATLEGPDWLERTRRAAMDRFGATGFPAARDEEWRFTPVGPIAQTAWRPPPSAARLKSQDLEPFIFGHPEWITLVFVNGIYRNELSSTGLRAEGIRAGNLGDALRRDGVALERHLARYATVESSPFTALSTALFREGGLVEVSANAEPSRPVHLVFVATKESAGSVVHPRNMILVERGARASVIESYVTLAPGASYWTNAVTEVALGANAWLEHTRIQRESERAYHIGATHVDQQRDSHYRSFTMAMGGAIARHNLHSRLNAENVETLLYGLYFARGDQLVDNHTVIYHDQPNCRSWEVYKGVLEDRSRAVFNGKVLVKAEAQKTDAKQTNRNLLLSDRAKVDTKPQLEIFADDVKCTHGATVGQLDEIALFYARSRGVPAAEARRLLTYAFAAEVIAEVALEPVREELERLVRERLGAEQIWG